MESWEGPHDEWGDSFMGWDDPVGPEGFLIHKHWCVTCQAYWQHDDADCPNMRNDGPELFGWQARKPIGWPCPEHEEKEKECD